MDSHFINTQLFIRLAGLRQLRTTHLTVEAHTLVCLLINLYAAFDRNLIKNM